MLFFQNWIWILSIIIILFFEQFFEIIILLKVFQTLENFRYMFLQKYKLRKKYVKVKFFVYFGSFKNLAIFWVDSGECGYGTLFLKILMQY